MKFLRRAGRSFRSWRFRYRLVRRWKGRGRLTLGAGNAFESPVRSDGAGSLSIGSGNSFGYGMAPRFGDGEILLQARAPGSVVSIGSNNAFSNNVSVIANERIVIGNDCLIGDRVSIFDSDFHEIDPAARRSGTGASKPVEIGNNVWIGSSVTVLKGVTIGDNSVIGVMSVVSKPVPPNSVAVGNPAKVIRTL